MDASPIDATKDLIISWKADLLHGKVTGGATVVVDNTNISEGFCEYLSDSHVLFFARDTSTAAINFYKYTLSGTTLTTSASGAVATLTGKSFILKGVRRFAGTNYFLFIIQNVTDGSPEAFIALYDTGTSTFTPVGSRVALAPGEDFDSSAGYEQSVFAQIDATHMAIATKNAADNGVLVHLITRADATSTTPVWAQEITLTEEYEARPAISMIGDSTFAVSYMGTAASGAVWVYVYELATDRASLILRASREYGAAPNSGNEPILGCCFPAGYGQIGLMVKENSTDGSELEAGIGALTYTKYAGIARRDGDSGELIEAVIKGISDDNSGLTHSTDYYAGYAGTIGTDTTGHSIGYAVDTDKLLLS
jgi:hypothetical protein